MARRLQIGALILGMILVAAERYTASASQLTSQPTESVASESLPIPPN